MDVPDICRRIEEAAKTEIGRRLLSHHLKFLHQDRFQDVSTDINKLYEKLSTEIHKLTEADTYIYQKIDSKFASLIKLHEDIYAKIESGNDMLRADIDLIKDSLRVWLDEISLLKESIGNAPNVHLKLTAIESEIVRVKATLAAIQVAQAGALLSEEDSSYDNLISSFTNDVDNLPSVTGDTEDLSQPTHNTGASPVVTDASPVDPAVPDVLSKVLLPGQVQPITPITYGIISSE